MDKVMDSLKITDRLLSQEAQRRGYRIEVFESTLHTNQAILRAEKDGKEFIYSSTLTHSLQLADT